MTKLKINAKSSALLVMDCQVGIVNSLSASEKEKVLGNLTRAIRAARMAGVLVIFVIVRFRIGYPDISPNNVLFSMIRDAGYLQEGATNTEICPEINPQPDDLIVIKKRISAFTGSDLEVVLRSRNIDTVILTGVSSLGVVESTARSAVDMDYRTIVLDDCCSDSDTDAHQIALKWLLPRTSTVCSSEDMF